MLRLFGELPNIYSAGEILLNLLGPHEAIAPQRRIGLIDWCAVLLDVLGHLLCLLATSMSALWLVVKFHSECTQSVLMAV